MRFAIALCVSIFVLSAFAQNCAEQTRCGSCTAVQGCGWCAATVQCMPGTALGPSAQNAYCYGSWAFGDDSCIDCTSFRDCRQCQQFRGDCVWCKGSGGLPDSCQVTGTLGCAVTNTCPCDIYRDCSSCVNAAPECGWCLGNGTCVKTSDTSKCAATPLSTCPCSFQTNCQSCNDDLQGCVWCDTVGSCINDNGTCPIPHEGHNCNKYCAEMGTSCDSCNDLQGCGWCKETQTCVDASTTTCMLTHNCPNCPSLSYCSACLATDGCVWCRNSESCSANGVDKTCLVSHSCNAYCGEFHDCGTCQRKKGCGWCDDTSTCVDASSSQCFLAHSCGGGSAGQTCGFDGGAFVGGMFLVIGIIVVSVAGYLFYRWRVGKKISYTELR